MENASASVPSVFWGAKHVHVVAQEIAKQKSWLLDPEKDPWPGLPSRPRARSTSPCSASGSQRLALGVDLRGS